MPATLSTPVYDYAEEITAARLELNRAEVAVLTQPESPELTNRFKSALTHYKTILENPQGRISGNA